jgi:heavy metal response regulator
MKILVVEDEKKMGRYIKKGLEENHYTVDLAFDGEEALFMGENYEYDLIILDIILPKKSGIEVLKALRGKGVTTPIMVLTIKDSIESKVEAIDLGADDYITKPFSFIELLARVRALLRRGKFLSHTELKALDLTMDLVTHRVNRGGKDIELTNKEFALLELLMRNVNRVMTRTVIIENIWGYNFDNISNVVDVFINRLRNKIDKNYPIKLIHTVKGVGYIIKDKKHD